MDSRELKHAALLREWRERITACRSSGQTVSRWCREEGIAPKTYYRREREVLDLAGERLAVRSGSESPAFVEVRAAPETGGDERAGPAGGGAAAHGGRRAGGVLRRGPGDAAGDYWSVEGC